MVVTQVDLDFDGKTYISSNRASEITGYSNDYIGQLSRAEKVKAKKIDRAWFVEKQSILAHKKSIQLAQKKETGVLSPMYILRSPVLFEKKEIMPIVMSAMLFIVIVFAPYAKSLTNRGLDISNGVVSDINENISASILSVKSKAKDLTFAIARNTAVGFRLTLNDASDFSGEVSLLASKKYSSIKSTLQNSLNTLSSFGLSVINLEKDFFASVDSFSESAEHFAGETKNSIFFSVVNISDNVNTNIADASLASQTFVSRASDYLYDSVVRFSKGVYNTINGSYLAVASLAKSLGENNTALDNISEDETARQSGIVILPPTDDENAITKEIEEIKRRFSDEVTVVFDETGGSGVIKPVFRNNTDESYSFVLVPINRKIESKK